MTNDFTITLNEAEHRFELALDGHLAIAVFEPIPGGIALVETRVPHALEGRGIGSALVRHALNHAQSNHWRVRPDCTFVKAYIDRHPEYRALSLPHDASDA